jgi:hypothetical protein
MRNTPSPVISPAALERTNPFHVKNKASPLALVIAPRALVTVLARQSVAVVPVCSSTYSTCPRPGTSPLREMCVELMGGFNGMDRKAVIFPFAVALNGVGSGAVAAAAERARPVTATAAAPAASRSCRRLIPPSVLSLIKGPPLIDHLIVSNYKPAVTETSQKG